jgi:arylsulfatase A
VSSALSSTLDVFPTFLSLAGRPLPSDRSYDGMDLTPLLMGRSAHAHSTLFHPDHNGDLSAMRHGSLKVHFRVTQAPPCVPNDTRPVDVVLADFPFVLHNQAPLVFDLDHDPAESTPIQVHALFTHTTVT